MKIKSSNRKDKIAALQGNRYFSGLRDKIIRLLSTHIHLYRYEPGESIFWEGDECQGLYILKSGRVKLYKNSPSGRVMIIKILEAGESFNEVPVFDQKGNPVNAGALEESEIWMVEAAPIRQLVEQHPDAAQKIIHNLSQNLRMLVDLAADLSFYPVTSRLAHLLLELPEEILTGESGQRITQDELASRIGTVREVVARSLRDLEVSGAIRVSQGRIEIKDRNLLQGWECK